MIIYQDFWEVLCVKQNPVKYMKTFVPFGCHFIAIFEFFWQHFIRYIKVSIDVFNTISILYIIFVRIFGFERSMKCKSNENENFIYLITMLNFPA